MMKTTSPTRAALSGLVLAAGLAFGWQGANAATAAPPVQTFFKPASLWMPLLSPSGKYIAILADSPTGHRRLLVLDTSDIHKIDVLASYGDSDVTVVRWVSDERLVYWVGNERDAAWLRTQNGMFAIDRDGKNLSTLIVQGAASETTHVKSRVLDGSKYWFLDSIRDGSDDVVIGKGQWGTETLDSVTPMRLNTRTGNLNQILTGTPPDFITDWVFDEHARPLAAIAAQDDKQRLLVADGKGWKTVSEFSRFGISPNAVSLQDVGADGVVYVAAAEASAEQTSALYKLDPQTGKVGAKAVVSLKGFDFDGALVPNLKTHTVAGVHYVNDANGTVWFDPAMRAAQADVDAKLASTSNSLQPAECGCSTKIVVTASSDRQPPAYFLYDSEAKTLVLFGGVAPDVDARQMADTDFFRFKARDGMEIPVYLTKPAGKGPFPTVVLVHGGPNLRGRNWDFDPEAQFLASRGYAVVQPEFRGSTGYGALLTHAGFKQWGLAMDDDLVDATRWAVARGAADPKRVCVMGGSYGGYATLMALIKDPDVFRCGVAYSAVSDISLLYDLQWSDASTDYKGYGMPELVGDRVKDAAQFDATSPLKLAARLKQPLLLEHGGVDVRVPVEHAEKMRSALLSSGKTNLDWVRYEEEGHGISKPENRYDFYTRVEKFLDAQIGPGSLAKQPTAQ